MRSLAVFALAAIALASCSDIHTELIPLQLGERPDLDGGTTDEADSAVDTGVEPEAPVYCGGKVCKCDDGKDNDDDGLVDGLDPECTSRIDDDEESFAVTDRKGPPNACEDCFWDGNTSADDDGCAYSNECRTEGPAAEPGPPVMLPPMATMCRSCEVAPRCIDTCRSQTPNGCDCFGCCGIAGEDGAVVNVLLSDDCALKDVGNEKKCPRCEPNPNCFNPCGPCERCFGKTDADLAEMGCTGDGTPEAPSHQCEEGYKPCSAEVPCPEEFYCFLGCCMVTVY